MKTPIAAIHLILGLLGAAFAAEPQGAGAPVDAARIKDIKAYCLDFNWEATARKRKPFAAPGSWAGAHPVRNGGAEDDEAS